MRAGVTAAAFAAVLWTASPLRAQYLEIVPLTTAGYTTGKALEGPAAGLSEVRIEGGFTWGGQVAWFFSPSLGVEVSWLQQETRLTLATAAGQSDLFDMSAGQLHGNFVYQFRGDDATLRPFAFVGLGATFFSATDVRSETKFSWAIGAGVKYFAAPRVGLRVHVRYKPTRLGDSGEEFCDPFGFCQDGLGQWELAAGLALRF